MLLNDLDSLGMILTVGLMAGLELRGVVQKRFPNPLFLQWLPLLRPNWIENICQVTLNELRQVSNQDLGLCRR
jgi:hypothetical protein